MGRWAIRKWPGQIEHRLITHSSTIIVLLIVSEGVEGISLGKVFICCLEFLVVPEKIVSPDFWMVIDYLVIALLEDSLWWILSIGIASSEHHRKLLWEGVSGPGSVSKLELILSVLGLP